jgi:hypothetical protein
VWPFVHRELWGPLRLYLITLCIALCTTAHSDSHCSSCRSLIRELSTSHRPKREASTGASRTPSITDMLLLRATQQVGDSTSRPCHQSPVVHHCYQAGATARTSTAACPMPLVVAGSLSTGLTLTLAQCSTRQRPSLTSRTQPFCSG